MKPLSKRQLSVLGQMSNKAYRHLLAVGYPLDGYDAWRHEFTAEHCGGIASWRALNQLHYVPLCNALRAIIGLAPKEDNTPQTEEQNLIWHIRDNIAVYELPAPYVAKIIAGKTSRPWVKPGMSLETMLAGCTYKEVFDVLKTVRARGEMRHKKESRVLGLPPVPRTHISRSSMPPERLAKWRGDILATPPPTRRQHPASPPATAP